MSLFSYMTSWGEAGLGSKKNAGDSDGNSNMQEDTEEDVKKYQNCDFLTEMQIERQQSSSSTFSVPSSASMHSALSRNEQKSAAIAACCIMDYEDGQMPTLSNNFSGITRRQLLLYRVKHSCYWKIFGLSLATILLFIPSFNHRLLTFVLHTFSILVFAMDLYIIDQLFDDEKRIASRRLLFDSMKVFLVLTSLQTLLELFFPNVFMVHAFALCVSVCKPIVFYYQSRRARDAMEALIRISKKLLRVLLIEMILILVFATVACRLYHNHESFQSLPEAWISLFAREFILKFYCSPEALPIISHLIFFFFFSDAIAVGRMVFITHT